MTVSDEGRGRGWRQEEGEFEIQLGSGMREKAGSRVTLGNPTYLQKDDGSRAGE